MANEQAVRLNSSTRRKRRAGRGKQEVVEGPVKGSKLSQKWSFITEEHTAGAKGQVTECSTGR